MTDFRLKLTVSVFLWWNSCHEWYISWPVPRYILRFAGATRENIEGLPKDAHGVAVTFPVRHDCVRHDFQYNPEGLVWMVVAQTQGTSTKGVKVLRQLIRMSTFILGDGVILRAHSLPTLWDS